MVDAHLKREPYVHLTMVRCICVEIPQKQAFALLEKGAKDAGPCTRSALLPLMGESYLTYIATTRYLWMNTRVCKLFDYVVGTLSAVTAPCVRDTSSLRIPEHGHSNSKPQSLMGLWITWDSG